MEQHAYADSVMAPPRVVRNEKRSAAELLAQLPVLVGAQV
jgi:hypothetical protein